MEATFYQQQARKTAVYPTDSKIVYPLIGMVGEVGEVAEKIKRILRGDDGANLDGIEDELGDVLWYLCNLMSDLDITLDSVMSRNIAKLRSRYERGVIKGNGDQR